MATQELITITEAAVEKLKDILAEQNQEGTALRVLAMPGGNGGVQYMLSLENEPKGDDFVMETDSIKVVVDADSAPLIEGASIDYIDAPMRSGFVVSNPNYQGGGGCGSGGGCACGGNCSCGGGH